MQSKSDPNLQQEQANADGVTLAYSGMTFGPSSFADKKFKADHPGLTPLEALTERFKNMGALLIRFNLGQRQRAGLLQQVSKSNYQENPIEKMAFGKDDSNLFFQDERNSLGNSFSQFLEYSSHLTLGRSKVINELTQPIIHSNLEHTYGEQKIFDIMHAPIWNVGRALKFELSRQGFRYLACPALTNRDGRALIDEALRDLNTHYKEVISDLKLDTILTEISKVKIHLDDKVEFTSESNGIAISIPEYQEQPAPAPLGWIIEVNSGTILPQEVTEDIIRVMAIAEGFNERSLGQQNILRSGGLLNKNGMSLFTQNQSFNAMHVIFKKLEPQKFDPRPLLDSSLLLAYQRFQEATKEDPSIIDDFLVGALQLEMVQPLKITQPKSKRSTLPERFTDRFDVGYNNLKAIAYAFELKDCGGDPIFRKYDDSPIITSDSELIDAKVNGELVSPSFNTGSHVASIIATAVLVAEQMILEQLLPEASSENNTLDELLIALLGEEQGSIFYSELMKELPKFPHDQGKPILGSQFTYCQNILLMIRDKLGLTQLPLLILPFVKPGASTIEAMNELDFSQQAQLNQALKTLHTIGIALQKSPMTSAQSEHSRGINAGLEPLISSLFPELAKELEINKKRIIKADVPHLKTQRVNDRMSAKALTQCPYLRSMNKGDDSHSTENDEQTQSTGVSFFQSAWNHKKGIGLAIAITASALIGAATL